MIKSFIKITFRNLKRQPLLTFINIFGLAIGIAGSLFITLYITDELSYNTMFKDADRIYRINSDIKFGGSESFSSETPAPMAQAIEDDYPEVLQTTRLRDQGEMLVRNVDATENVQEPGVTFVDPSFLEIFGIDLLAGNRETALTEINTVVITESAANRHFGAEEAVGKNLLLNNNNIYLVTGVIRDLPKNSFLESYTLFLAMEGNAASKENQWGGHNFHTFIKIKPDTNLDTFNKKLDGLIPKYLMPWAQTMFPGITMESFTASGNYIRYSSMALEDIYLYSDRADEMNPTSSIQNVYILSFVAIFLLLLAIVNFMNLSTAHSLKRAKEVGIRKTLGSDKKNLILQFLTESILVSFISLIIALTVVFLLLPSFNALAGKAINFPFAKAIFWLTLLFGTLVLGLLAGSYPAFFLSRFKTIDTLKGGVKHKGGGMNVRSTLVVFQFGISLFLIIATLVVYQQLNYIQNKDLGFSKEQVLLIEDAYAAGKRTKTLKESILQLSAVENVSLSGFLPTPSYRSSSSFFIEGDLQQENALQMQEWGVDHDYLQTLGMELLTGRDFNPNNIADSTAIILNESALIPLGLNKEEVLGKRIVEPGGEELIYYTVIGVIKDFHFDSMRKNIGALSLFLSESTGTIAIKLQSAELGTLLPQIKVLWNKFAPGQPFNYRFMDDAYNTTFIAEKRLGRIFIVFTILSIFIACLGLFGLATFNTQNRVKEIGVRKVLGASVGQISLQLILDFLKLVGIATLIALPLGWYIMNIWLQEFSYRTSISWQLLVASGLLVFIIAIATIGFQALRAAMANPVRSLRVE